MKKISSFVEDQVNVPSYNVLPYDFSTREDIKDILKQEETLQNDEWLRSKDSLFSVIIRKDNNLVIYLKTDKMGGTKEIWSSKTTNSDLGKGVLNLVKDGRLQVTNSIT